MTVSVVLTTSPTSLTARAHAEMVQEVVASTQVFSELHGCDIVIGADGVSDEQEPNADAYRAALQGLAWWANYDAGERLAGTNAIQLRVLPEWQHQANTLRVALEHVTSDLVLVMEHDTPLCAEPIEWPAAFDAVRSEELDVVRFYPETKVRDEWRHLLLDQAAKTTESGLRYLRTAQWSQRPHLARTVWYKRMLGRYFAPYARCYVEEVLQPVCDYWCIGAGGLPDEFKLGIYAPLGDSIQRSGHLDARAGAARPVRQVFAYPGDVRPQGAPGFPTGKTVLIGTDSFHGEESEWTD